MHLDYDTSLTVLSAWIAVTLLVSIVMLASRPDKGAKDYGMLLFLVAVDFVFFMLWLRRIFAWPPQIVIPTFAVLAVSSTGLMLWIGERIWHDHNGSAP